MRRLQAEGLECGAQPLSLTLSFGLLPAAAASIARVANAFCFLFIFSRQVAKNLKHINFYIIIIFFITHRFILGESEQKEIFSECFTNPNRSKKRRHLHFYISFSRRIKTNLEHIILFFIFDSHLSSHLE